MQKSGWLLLAEELEKMKEKEKKAMQNDV